MAPTDASRIVFVSDRTGNLDVFTMDPLGGNLVQVTDDGSDDDDPSLSPDRSQVAFASERDGNLELYVKNADGSGTPTRLTNMPDNEWDAAYSPDGSRIAFLFAPVGTSNWDLYSMAADGTDIVQLTDNSEFDANPAWSPGRQSDRFPVPTRRRLGDLHVGWDHLGHASPVDTGPGYQH